MKTSYTKKLGISLFVLILFTSGCFLPGRDETPEPSEEPGGLEAVTEINLDLTNDWYVDTTGDVANSCATPEEPCLTLADAYRKSFHFDRIHIAAGTYLGADGTGESLPTLSHSIVVIGEGSGTTIINVNNNDDGWMLTSEVELRLEGVTIQNTGSGSTSACLETRGSAQITAQDVVLQGCWKTGLLHTSTGLVQLTDVIITDTLDEDLGLDFLTSGNGILNSGALVIQGGEIRNSESIGILNRGPLTMTGTIIRDNQADGIRHEYAGASQLTNVTITNNGVVFLRAGMLVREGTVNISGSMVTANANQAIFLSGTSILNMNTSTISDHPASALNITANAEAELTDVTLENNGTGPEWAPVILNNGTLTLTESLIINNFQEALYNSDGGLADIFDSEISGNSSEFDTVRNFGTSEMRIERSLIANNTVADPFAAALINTGLMELENTTISNNNRAGIRIDEETLISFVTIAENGGTGVNQGGEGPFTVANIIIAKNSGGDCTTSFAFYSGSLSGNNIDTDSTCGFPETYSPTDIRLGGLADNGGSTFTHELLNDPDSPAIDTATGACPTTDQREFSRVGLCDVGAYETSAVALSLEAPGFVIGTPTPGVPGTVTIITTTPCYRGPGPQYGLVNNLSSGISTQLVGAGFTGNGNQDWVVASHPTAANTNCWLDSDDVTPSIPFGEMRLITVPGLPTPTPRPTSDRPAPDDTPVPCYYNANNVLICP